MNCGGFQWTTDDVTATCAGMASKGGSFYDTRVVPYLDTTVKGWVWYQGPSGWDFPGSGWLLRATLGC